MAFAPAVPPEDEFAPPRPSRRRLYWFLAIVASVFGGIFAIIVYSDAEPPDVSDLAFEPVKVADEDNLYLHIVAHGKRFAAAPLFADDEVDELAPLPADSTTTAGLFGRYSPQRPLLKDRLLAGEGWTPERLAKWKVELDAAAQIARGLQLHVSAQANIGVGNAKPIQDFSTRLQLAVWAAYRNGNSEDAANLALIGLRLGKTIRDARGISLDYMTGTEMITAFQEAIQRLAAQRNVSPNTLFRLLRGTLEIELIPNSYEHTLKNDFRLVAVHIPKFDAEEAESDFFARRYFKSFRPIIRTRVLFPLIYKPNATLDLYADLIREKSRLSRKAPKDWLSITSPPSSSNAIRSPWNAYGQTLVAFARSSAERMAQMLWSPHTQQKALQAYLALRLFHLETGRLPSSLDELVPHYLPSVPIDDVDGSPLRYSSEYRAVWSHGYERTTGLVISSADQEVDEREICYHLDFAAAPEAKDMDTKKAPLAAGPSE